MQDLTKSSVHPMGGQAYLSLENSEDPFLHGIKFTAMPPSKRFREMEQLSGGEKVINGLVPTSRAIFGNAFLHFPRSTPACTYLAYHVLESVKIVVIVIKSCLKDRCVSRAQYAMHICSDAVHSGLSLLSFWCFLVWHQSSLFYVNHSTALSLASCQHKVDHPLSIWT